METSRLNKGDACIGKGCGGTGGGGTGGDDSPNFDLSLSNTRSNGGAGTRSVC